MSTLEISKLRYFKWPSYFKWGNGVKVVLLPILVIAFTVKVSSFEGESNHIRQALRQEQQELLVSQVKKELAELKLDEKIETDSVFPDLGGRSQGGLSPYELARSILDRAYRWEEENRGDKVLRAVAIISTTNLGEKKLAFTKKNFSPVGGIVFFVRKENTK